VSVKDFGAVGDGVTNDTAAFNAASAANKQVFVPAGTYLLSSNITNVCTWVMHAAASVTGGTLTPVGSAYSGCRVVALSDSSALYNKGTKIGSSSVWTKTVFGALEDTSDLAVVSRTGTYAFVSSTRSSDYTTATVGSQATIGITGFANNDLTSPLVQVYGGYYEVQRQSSCGTAQGIEIDTVNYGSNISGNPYNQLPIGATNALWLASGASKTTISSTLGLGFAKNGATFNTGLSFGSDSITGSNGVTGTGIAIAMAKGHQIAWYSADAAIVGTVFSSAPSGTTPQSLEFSSSGTNIAAGSALTIKLGATGPFLAITNPTSSNFTVNNASGGSIGFATSGTIAASISNTAIYPGADATLSLGISTLRWTAVYSVKYTVKDGTGNADIYVDVDNSLKVKFGNGTVKTLATNP
jgi:hypothetical protein